MLSGATMADACRDFVGLPQILAFTRISDSSGICNCYMLQCRIVLNSIHQNIDNLNKK